MMGAPDHEAWREFHARRLRQRLMMDRLERAGWYFAATVTGFAAGLLFGWWPL